jgi:hypothetical protein
MRPVLVAHAIRRTVAHAATNTQNHGSLRPVFISRHRREWT